MKTKLLLPAVVLLAAVSACAGSSAAPSAASPLGNAANLQTPTISLGGNLSFGAVPLGSHGTGLLVITNNGTGTLSVSSIAMPASCPGAYTASLASVAVAAGASQSVTITFTPSTVQDCGGNITVVGNQAGGTNVIPVAGSGTLNGVPVFTMSGVGNATFTMPTYVTRVRIVGTLTSAASSFIVSIGGTTVINLVGTFSGQTVDDGIYATTGGNVVITNSAGVTWTFTEVR